MDRQAAAGAGSAGFGRGVLYTGAGSLVNLIFLFFETMVAVRFIPTESYGIYVLLVAVVNFFVVAVDFGCKTAVTRMIASGDRSEQATLANTALAFRVIVVALVAALIWLGQDLLTLLDPSGALLLYAAFVPLMIAVASFDELLLGIHQGFRAYGRMAVAQTVRGVLRFGMTLVLLVVFELGLMALIYSWMLSFVVSSAYQYLRLPISKRFICRRPLLGEMLRFGFPLQMTRFLWFVFRRIDVLLLGSLVGPASVAYYAVASRIPEALQHLSESFIAVFFPTMAGLLGDGKRQAADRILNQSLRLVSFGGALAALTAVLFSQQIITLLFSDRYEASSFAFGLLMIAFHMTFVVGLMSYTLTSAGYSGRSLGVSVSRTIVHVISDIVLIPIFGFLGPAYAGLISSYTTNPVAVWVLRRSAVRVIVRPYAKQTLLLLLGAGLFWWLQPTEPLYKVAIILAYVVLGVLWGTVSRDDLRLLWPVAGTKDLDLGGQPSPDGHAGTPAMKGKE